MYISEDGRMYRYLINNSAFESYVKIVKTDAESGKAIPYAGAGFQIFNADGEQITMSYTYPEYTVVDTFYTNSEGFLITPERLPYGEGFYIVEVQAPYGYVLNSEPVYFDVSQEDSSDEGPLTVVIVSKPNMPQKGRITVTKIGEAFASVTCSGDVYRPVYEDMGLAEAVFEVSAAEDIYTPDGTLHYAAGDVVDTVTTGPDGTAVTKELYLGRYTVREITAPHGSVADPTPHDVELTYVGQEISVTETSTECCDRRQRAGLSLEKAVEQDGDFHIGMNGEITAVTFGLYAAEELILIPD